MRQYKAVAVNALSRYLVEVWGFRANDLSDVEHVWGCEELRRWKAYPCNVRALDDETHDARNARVRDMWDDVMTYATVLGLGVGDVLEGLGDQLLAPMNYKDFGFYFIVSEDTVDPEAFWFYSRGVGFKSPVEVPPGQLMPGWDYRIELPVSDVPRGEISPSNFVHVWSHPDGYEIVVRSKYIDIRKWSKDMGYEVVCRGVSFVTGSYNSKNLEKIWRFVMGVFSELIKCKLAGVIDGGLFCKVGRDGWSKYRPGFEGLPEFKSFQEHVMGCDVCKRQLRGDKIGG